MFRRRIIALVLGQKLGPVTDRRLISLILLVLLLKDHGPAGRRIRTKVNYEREIRLGEC